MVLERHIKWLPAAVENRPLCLSHRACLELMPYRYAQEVAATTRRKLEGISAFLVQAVRAEGREQAL